jgi:hypothetical protein
MGSLAIRSFQRLSLSCIRFPSFPDDHTVEVSVVIPHVRVTPIGGKEQFD